MKKLICILFFFPFTSSYALDVNFNVAKNEPYKVEYPWDISLTRPLGWYLDFWNNIFATKNYHSIHLIWDDLKDLPAYKSEKIPDFDEVFLYFKNILWENTFKKLLINSQISIYWEQNKCENGTLIHPSLKEQLISCLYENDTNLSTNTKNIVSYFVESPKTQKIKVKIFPVTNKEYLFYTYDDGENGKFPLLTFIDSSLDYYNISLKYSSWKSGNWFDTTQIDFKKKYMLTKFDKNTYKLPWNIWIVREMLNTIYTFIPYYETEIELQKWWNTVILEYSSYTPYKETLNKSILIQP